MDGSSQGLAIGIRLGPCNVSAAAQSQTRTLGAPFIVYPKSKKLPFDAPQMDSVPFLLAHGNAAASSDLFQVWLRVASLQPSFLSTTTHSKGARDEQAPLHPGSSGGLAFAAHIPPCQNKITTRSSATASHAGLHEPRRARIQVFHRNL